jgi:hypothetical protein
MYSFVVVYFNVYTPFARPLIWLHFPFCRPIGSFSAFALLRSPSPKWFGNMYGVLVQANGINNLKGVTRPFAGSLARSAKLQPCNFVKTGLPQDPE